MISLKHYWYAKDLSGPERAAAIWDTVLALVRERDDQRQAWHRSLGYYMGNPSGDYLLEGSSFGLLDYQALGSVVDVDLDQSTMYNLCKMLPDALIARITLQQPWPSYETRNATEAVQVKAQANDRFLRRELNKIDVHPLACKRLRLACVFGTGMTKNWPDVVGEKICATVFGPDRLVFDNRAATQNRLPPSVFHVDMRDVSELLAMFPGTSTRDSQARAAIEKAPVVHSVEGIRHSVEVIESSWVEPSGAGMRVLSVAGDVLAEDKLERDEHMYHGQCYGKPLDGYLGTALVDDELISMQREVNYIDRKFRSNMRAHGDLYIEREPGSFVQNADLERDEDDGWEETRVMPPGHKVQLPAFIPPQMIELREMKKREAFEAKGLNLLSVTAMKPAGLDSGEALRVFNATQTQRFTEIEHAHSQAIKRDGELTVLSGRTLAVAGLYTDVDPEVSESLLQGEIDRETFTLSIKLRSSLEDDPAGQTQELVGMMKDGVIDRDEVRSQQQTLDLDKTLELENAPKNLVEDLCEQILAGKRRDVEAQPLMDLPRIVRDGRRYWNRALKNKVNQERLDALEAFVVSAQALMAPPPPDAPPAPEAVAPPPEAISGALPADPAAAAQLAQAQAALGGGNGEVPV